MDGTLYKVGRMDGTRGSRVYGILSGRVGDLVYGSESEDCMMD